MRESHPRGWQRPLLPHPHPARLDRPLPRTRRTARQVGTHSEATRPHMPAPLPRLHRSSRRSRPHRQREGRRRTLRPGERASSLHTMSRAQNSARSKSRTGRTHALTRYLTNSTNNEHLKPKKLQAGPHPPPRHPNLGRGGAVTLYLYGSGDFRDRLGGGVDGWQRPRSKTSLGSCSA